MRIACVSLLALAAVACAAPSEDKTASDDSAYTGVLSCSAKRKAALEKQNGTSPQGHWRYLELPVMQPVAGVLPIRQRMDALADEPLATRNEAFSLARRAASKLDLLSPDSIVAFLNKTYAFGLTVDGFEADGTYTKPYTPSTADFARSDLRAASYLVKNVFATADIGVTEGDALREKQRAELARTSWKSTNIPIAGDGTVTLEKLVAEGDTGSGRFRCGTWPGRYLLERTRLADAKLGADGKTSFVELVAYVEQQYGATIEMDPFTITYPGAEPGDSWPNRAAFECAFQAFYFGAQSILRPDYATLPMPGGNGLCGTIDLLAHQGGGGTRFTGHVVSVTMGQKDYEVVMMKASLLSAGIRGMLCLDPEDELKLYVPYGKATISECGLVNGMYRAAYYGLDARVESDNWSPN